MRILSLFVLLILGVSNIYAQQIRPMPSAQIYQKLKQLNQLGTVMYLAAHPDDENTRLISYLVHHENIRTVYLSLTRGDGGQNILGSEQGSALGLIRSYEMMEARKLDGAEQLFGSAVDFGFSKSPLETFSFWNEEKIYQDIVDAINLYKPDIIICRFPTTGEGGHGHHTASAIAALNAYKKLEQEKKRNFTVWLPKRLLFNAFQFGDRSTIKDGQYTLSTNQYDPLLGESYGENAGRSRSMHKSQGAGTPQRTGLFDEHFELMAGEKISNSIFDGIDRSWARIERQDIGSEIEKIIDQFSFVSPQSSIEKLLEVREKIDQAINSTEKKLTDNSLQAKTNNTNIADIQEQHYYLLQKKEEIDAIIISCAGLMIEALADKQEYVGGEKSEVNINVIARGKNIPITIKDIQLGEASKQQKNTSLHSDSLYSYKMQMQFDLEEEYTEPYWMKKPIENNHFVYEKQEAIIPVNSPAHYAIIQLAIADATFYVKAPVSYKRLDPVRGDVVEPIRIIPAISILPQQGVVFFDEGKNMSTALRIKSFEHIQNGQLIVKANNQILLQEQLPTLYKGLDTIYTVTIPTHQLDGTNNHSQINFTVSTSQRSFDKGMNLIQYPHIPELQYFQTASVKAVKKQWQTKAQKVGYITGVGDLVKSTLELCGINIEEIPHTALASPDYLKKFDAIVIGIRALNTQQEVAAQMNNLLNYVENGGNLIVQYNMERNLHTQLLGPYPIKLSRNRVTNENAKVRLIDKTSPLLNYPNKITQEDFDNWVQERGVYYASEWDKKYQTILGMNDPGEKELHSAILYTPHGKGHYIYTSLSFFRQLPAGNIGAIKLIMNMLSQGKE